MAVRLAATDSSWLGGLPTAQACDAGHVPVVAGRPPDGALSRDWTAGEEEGIRDSCSVAMVKLWIRRGTPYAG